MKIAPYGAFFLPGNDILKNMLEPWLNFSIVVFVQLVLFVISAYYQKRLSDIPRILGLSVLIGIVFGALVDFILGKFFGLHSYTLGFGVVFLILNWILLNGLFVANTLLAERMRLPYFYLWTIILVAAYEIPNHFFRVWTWEFQLSPIVFLIVLSAGYFGGAILVAVISHVFFGHRFLFIDNLLKE